MVYMGSKAKYADKIVPLLQKIIDEKNITTYIEPFVGGANIIDKIKCQHKYGYDKNFSLIALHQKAQSAFEDIPEHGNREWWDKAKMVYRKNEGKPSQEDISDWEIGAIAFLASFSNGGFSRGYAKNNSTRDYYNEAYKNLKTQATSDLYKDIIFDCKEFHEIEIPDNSLIYCDPPYINTKPYGYKFETFFDYDFYYNWIREISKNNIVICSEQVFPDDFKIIWEQNVKRTCGKDNNFKALEKLGTLNNI